MNVGELKNSNFLKKEDCGRGLLVTIDKVEQVNVAKEGAPADMKWCLFFVEMEKPMVLNSTNGQLIAQITGSDESDNWTGHKVVIYNDPNVSFGGKLTGGIRIRASRAATAKTRPPVVPVQPPEPENDANEDLGF
ncbi:MAG: hypothetical protein WC455_20365 [Dehalococcoidia bacterium]|jgi:hypothetical protein